ncbi:MAG: hypothetical protein HY712_05255 [candidate division NC10 bacterium]|nr:hypothetical protein [candidate division NC10 bacterium]
MTILEKIKPRQLRPKQAWRDRMEAVATPLRQNLYAQRELILVQVNATHGFMRLLMKATNTGHTWTRREIRELRIHLRTLVRLIPILIVFILPGGFLLFPILAEVLDRRKTLRKRTRAETPPKDGA